MTACEAHSNASVNKINIDECVHSSMNGVQLENVLDIVEVLVNSIINNRTKTEQKRKDKSG